jgi:hypothetical protein
LNAGAPQWRLKRRNELHPSSLHESISANRELRKGKGEKMIQRHGNFAWRWMLGLAYSRGS